MPPSATGKAMDAILASYLDDLRNGREGALTDEQLSRLTESYPFFVLPYATAASAERDPERRRALMARVATTATDRDMLFRLTDPDGARFAEFYPDEKAATPDTDSAIDTFLNTYGRRDSREDALLERLIFNPVADYSAVLEKEAAGEGDGAEAPRDSQDLLLDAFLAGQQKPTQEPEPEPEPVPVEQPAAEPRRNVAPAPAPDSSLNESLAKIYIQRGRYDKAYEIIHQLSLNFPKKSIYFADQLRFLKKLIRNQQCLDNRKQ